MAKDTKQKPEASKPEAGKQAQPADSAAQQPVVKAKKSLMPYLLLGGGTLALLAIVVAGTLFVIQSRVKKTSQPKDKKEIATAPTDTAHVSKLPENPVLKPILAGTDLPEAKPASAESLADADLPTDSADLIPAAVDTAAAMAQLSKTIQVMDDANQAGHASDASLTPEDSIKESEWVAKARAALSQKEAALNARAAELDKRDKDISAKLMRLEKVTSDRVTNLAKLYDGMDPTAVAKLMANLDDSLVVELIPRMKQKNASDVMSLLPPARAANISKQIITLADDK